MLSERNLKISEISYFQSSELSISQGSPEEGVGRKIGRWIDIDIGKEVD